MRGRAAKQSKVTLYTRLILISFLVWIVLEFPSLDFTSTARSVINVTGKVEIQIEGRSNFVQAYKGMKLNNYDDIITSNNSSLTFTNGNDDITIGSNSKLHLTDLSKNNGLSIEFGSMWVKAKYLHHSDDSYEVETPKAIMGVRSVQFFTDKRN